MRAMLAVLLFVSLGAAAHEDGEPLTVEQTVSAHVAPLREAIAEERARVHLRDAVGGVGYILGVMGLVAYLKSGSARAKSV